MKYYREISGINKEVFEIDVDTHILQAVTLSRQRLVSPCQCCPEVQIVARDQVSWRIIRIPF